MSVRVNSTVAKMKDLHLEGNIIPIQWFQHICYENGKPDTNAILLLSDIVYWYRPRIVRDEQTGHVLGYQKKFKADLLQKSYQDYETLFGFSKKQIREAFIHLEELGLIKRIFRTIETDFGPRGNVMYIDINPSKVAEISLRVPPLSLEVNRGFPERKEGIPSKEIAISLKGKTYTETTPKTTTKILSSPSVPQSVDDSRAEEEDEMRKFDLDVKEEVSDVSPFNPTSPLQGQGRGERVPAQAARAEPVLRASDLVPPPTCVKPETRFEDTPESLMLNLWNTIVQKELAGGEEGMRPSVRLTLERIAALKKIYQDLCDRDLSLWEKACRTIVSSSFLMGEVPNTKFKVSFDWLLRPANFLKVIEGGFTSGDRRLLPSLSAADPLPSFLKTYDATPDLQKVLSEIAALLGTSSFLNWFGKASFVLEGGALTVSAPTRFIRDWIATHFLEDLRRRLKSVSSIDLSLEEPTA